MRTLILSLLLMFASSSWAAGGGGMGGGDFSSAPTQSPQELAISNYNQGIKARDKAWRFEKEAESASSEKQRDKLLRKSGKQFGTAAKRFAAAVKHNPRLYQAHSSLGYALRRLGRYEESLAAYNQALALNPRYAEAIEYRGEAYLALGQIDATKAAYVQLLKLDDALAAELLDAIQAWLTNPPAEASGDDVDALRRWTGERLALSAMLPAGAGESHSW